MELTDKNVCANFCEARIAYAILSQFDDLRRMSTLVCISNGTDSAFETLMQEMGVTNIKEACEVVFLLEIDYVVSVPKRRGRKRKRARIN